MRNVRQHDGGELSLVCVGGEAAGQLVRVDRRRLRHDEEVRVIVREPLPPLRLTEAVGPIDNRVYARSHIYRVTQYSAAHGSLFFLRPPEISAYTALETLLISYRKHHA